MDAPFERPEWFPTDLFPFESRTLEIEGHRIHYVDEGQGPTLLLLHGNPTWSFLYRHVIAGLRDRFRCVALDYPGFGLSCAAAGYDFKPASHARVVEAFVEALGLEDLTLMVQDWGGPIGLWVAGRHPERVSRLVIGNAWGWPIQGDRHFERFSALLGGPLGGFLIRHLNLFVNRLIPAGTPRSRPGRAVMDAYRGPFQTKDSRWPTHVFPREIRASHAFLAEVLAGLAKLRDKPALILWGDRDIAFRAKELARWRELFPGAALEMLPGSGHYIQEDAPDEIVAALRAFVER